MTTPDKLAKSNTEHAHQVALFAFAAIARLHGFDIAWKYAETGDPNVLKQSPHKPKVNEAWPCLKWFHAIPNGGIRGDDEKSRMIRGGQLKAEGVRRGVADTFLPYPNGGYCGLYIEMKKPSQKPKSDKAKGGMSDEQIEFMDYVKANKYGFATCYHWREAAKILQSYLTYEG